MVKTWTHNVQIKKTKHNPLTFSIVCVLSLFFHILCGLKGLMCWSMVVFALRLRIAFKWMVRAFSGYLSTDQLLLLWDRVLGYDSLEIIAGKSGYGSHICLDTVITWLLLVFQPFCFVLFRSSPIWPPLHLSLVSPSPVTHLLLTNLLYLQS